MITITIPKKELKTIVKESIREILGQESMKFKASLLPWVSQKEQKDIEKRYHKPSRNIGKSRRIKI